MSRIRKGVEYEGQPEVLPGAISIPKRSPRGLAAGGTGTIIVPTPGDASAGRSQQQWAVVYNGVTHIEAAGAGITVNDLSSTNANIQGLAYSFPGADADDNSWTIYWQTPLDWDNTKPVYVTIQAVVE